MTSLSWNSLHNGFFQSVSKITSLFSTFLLNIISVDLATLDLLISLFVRFRWKDKSAAISMVGTIVHVGYYMPRSSCYWLWKTKSLFLTLPYFLSPPTHPQIVHRYVFLFFILKLPNSLWGKLWNQRKWRAGGQNTFLLCSSFSTILFCIPIYFFFQILWFVSLWKDKRKKKTKKQQFYSKISHLDLIYLLTHKHTHIHMHE